VNILKLENSYNYGESQTKTQGLATPVAGRMGF